MKTILVGEGGVISLLAFIAALAALFSMSYLCPDGTVTQRALEVMAIIVPAYFMYRLGKDKPTLNGNGTTTVETKGTTTTIGTNQKENGV